MAAYRSLMKRMRLFFLTALLLATAAAAAAELKLTPLRPDGKQRPRRASVLLLGRALPGAVAEAAQAEMEDTATLYQAEPFVETVEQALALLEGPAWKRLAGRDWHAVLIHLPQAEPPAAPEAAALEAKLRKLAGAVRWQDARRETDAGALSGNLRQDLLQNSPPWAELPAQEKRDPARLLAEDALLAAPEALPVAPSQTATVFRAQEGQWQFNLHSFIAHHEGKFWAIWSSGRVNEDSSSQFIRYATSEDGLAWSDSGVVAGDPDGEDGPLRWLASGLYVEDGQLCALGCLNEGGKDGKIWAGAKLVRLQWTRGGWKDLGVFADKCMVYFPPMKVAGRDFFVWRDERAHFFTARSLPGAAGQWEVKKHPHFPPDYRMSETAAYADADGVLHLIIRDQGKTFRLYHSLSFDDGDTWTLPVKTNYPDAVSKNFAGRLSNGWFYLINNPRPNGLRDPLTISFSRDGWTFSNPKILRRDSPERRYPGGAKPLRSFQYADAMEHGGKLWVIYATNKEDIEVSAFEIEDLLKE